MLKVQKYLELIEDYTKAVKLKSISSKEYKQALIDHISDFSISYKTQEENYKKCVLQYDKALQALNKYTKNNI